MSGVLTDDFPLMLEVEAGMPSKVPPVAVAFGMTPMIDPDATAKAGHDVYKDVLFVKIAIPGDRNALYFQPAQDSHKKRFPKSWDSYKTRETTPLSGMPIEQWAVISRSMALTMKAAHITTVESLAELHDVHLEKFGFNGREMRDKAKAWLASRNDGAAAVAAATREKELQDRLHALEAQIAALTSPEAQERAAKPAKPARMQAAAVQAMTGVPMAAPVGGGAAGVKLLHDDVEADVAAAVRRPRAPRSEARA